MAQAITDSSFAAFVQDNTVAMVDCWATWCGPCRKLSLIIDELAQEMTGKVAIGKLNVDENPQVCEQFGIMSIPTLLIFKNGELVDHMVGAYPKTAIQDKLNALI